MRRIADTPRGDLSGALARFPYGPAAEAAAARWDESAHYEFTAAEVDAIEAAADEAHGLVMDAVRHVIENRLLGLLGIGDAAARMVESAWADYWRNGQPEAHRGGLYGRLDFACDGKGSTKLLGCCYDGPVGLFAASVAQWTWLEDRFADADQFNGLHEGLVERWGALARGRRGLAQVHLACATPDPPRQGECAYLAATAEEAGLAATFLPVQDIGWDGRHFRDLNDAEIAWLVKLYPWEAMLDEDYGGYLHHTGIPVQDPLWRMPASNHGLLATLWELYPEHPHLCRASLSEADLAGTPGVIRRSLLGLDRASERVTQAGEVVADTGPSPNPGGYVHIARPPLFAEGGTSALVNCWIVGDKCLGMTVRESDQPVLWVDAATVPHLFR